MEEIYTISAGRRFFTFSEEMGYKVFYQTISFLKGGIGCESGLETFVLTATTKNE